MVAMSPDSSATSMKSAGASMAPLGVSMRSKASASTTRPLELERMGW